MAYTKRKLVYGVGKNDHYDVVYVIVNGVKKQCKIYKTWKSMLERCYSPLSIKKRPTYAECYVCDEWLLFSKFRAWMVAQDWEGKHLDKDILFKGNKVYSPEACVFVSAKLNTFMLDCGSARGDLPIGVCWDKHAGKYCAKCNDANGRLKHLGLFDCPNKAHEAWRAFKHKIACDYANEQSDPRIAAALRARYASPSN